MRMNTAEVAEVLRNTLQTDANLRKEAERRIAMIQGVSGYGMALLELICSDQVPAEIRVAAAIVLKNFVKINWGENPEVEVGDVEQDQLRTALLSAMFANTGNLQKQLSHTVYLMAKKDFPERWPELINGLASQMDPTNPDIERLLAALNTMDQLLEKYRYESKSESLWRELKMCLLAVQAPLTTLYEWLVGCTGNVAQLPADAANSLFELINCVMRVFHSLCTQDLPEFFEDNLSRWVSGMLTLYTIDAPNVVSSSGESTALDKVKTEMCEIVTIYAQRYEEEIKDHMQSLIGAIWQLLVNTNSETRYDGMVCSALDFLSAICVRPQYEPMFKADGVLKTLAEDVAVKNLMLRQEDLELFEDEPIEYIMKDLEGTDAGTRRKGAVEFVRALCRQYEGALMPILSEVVTSFIADSANWMKRDVVYCLVRAMASRTETSRQGATSTSQLINIVDYYASNVRGDLCNEDVNSVPILKADALKFVVLFRNQLPPDALNEALVASEKLFTCTHTIVHKYAAYAIERLMLVRVNNTPIFTSSTVNVPSMMSRILGAFDADPNAHNSAYLIKALMRVVCIIDPSTARSAGEIATRLAGMVDAVIKQGSANANHTHFLFETICLLVKKTSGQVEGGIDRPLFPLLETILSQDLADYIPYALQVIALLLTECHARGAPTDTYLSFLPFLLKEELWAKTANVPAALVVVEAFLKVHPGVVMGTHGATLMQHYSRLIGIKSLDHYGFSLANAILPHIELMTSVDKPMQVLLNNMFRRVQFSKTPKFAKAFVVFFFRCCVVRGAQDIATVLESIQTGMFRMCLEKVIGPEMEKLADMTTQVEKRICAIGLAEMMESAIGVLGDLFGPLSEAGVKLCEGAVVHGSHVNEEDEQAQMYSEEGEFNTQYCKLQNAAPVEVLRPEITNWKKYFSEVVISRIGGANPAAMACLPDHVKQTLTVYISSV